MRVKGQKKSVAPSAPYRNNVSRFAARKGLERRRERGSIGDAVWRSILTKIASANAPSATATIDHVRWAGDENEMRP